MIFNLGRRRSDPDVVRVPVETVTTADWGTPRLRITGFGPPSSGTGVTGDWYFDLEPFVNQELVFPRVYGPKSASGQWPAPLSPVPNEDFYVAQDEAPPTDSDVGGPDIWIQLDPGGSLVWGPRQLVTSAVPRGNDDVIVWDATEEAWTAISLQELVDRVAALPQPEV